MAAGGIFFAFLYIMFCINITSFSRSDSNIAHAKVLPIFSLPARTRSIRSKWLPIRLKIKTRAENIEDSMTLDSKNVPVTVWEFLNEISSENGVAKKALEGQSKNIVNSTVVKETYDFLVNKLGTKDATTVVIDHIPVLRVSERSCIDCWDTLEQSFGHEAAREIVRASPAILERNSGSIHELTQAMRTILGDRSAGQYLKKSPRILTGGHTPERLLMSWRLLQTLFGPELAQSVVGKNPGILLSPPTTINGTWEYLKEEFGEDSAERMVSKSPGILRTPPQTVTGTVATLEELFDRETAISFILRCTACLTSPASTVRGAWEVLRQLVGDEDALALVQKTPMAILSPPSTMLGAFHCLEIFLGYDTTLELLKKNPGILRAPNATISSSWEALNHILKEDSASITDMVLRCPEVLRSPGRTIRGAYESLVAFLGEEKALELITQNPAVLRSPSRTLRGAWLTLKDLFGKETVELLVAKNPDVLRTPSGTILSAYKALSTCLGSEEMAKQLVCRSPSMVRVSADRMMQVYNQLSEVLGPAQAQQQFCKCPSVLKLGKGAMNKWIDAVITEATSRTASIELTDEDTSSH